MFQSRGPWVTVPPRGVGDGQRCRWRWGYTSYTGMSGVPWSYSRRNFQRRVTRKITGRQLKWWDNGGWEYPPPETVILETEFKYMRAYVLKRQNTVAHHIATRPILDLCQETVWRSGAWVSRIWWEKEVLYLAGTRAAVAEEADVKGGSEGERWSGRR